MSDVDAMAEQIVEVVRDELRMLTPPVTPTERAKRERIVEQWEAGELTLRDLQVCVTAVWIDDWPENELTTFLRKTILQDVPFLLALKQVGPETAALIARLSRDEDDDG